MELLHATSFFAGPIVFSEQEFAALVLMVLGFAFVFAYALIFIGWFLVKRKKPQLLTPVLKRIFMIFVAWSLVALLPFVVTANYGTDKISNDSAESTLLGDAMSQLGAAGFVAAVITLTVFIVMLAVNAIKDKKKAKQEATDSIE